jgi:tetratricopeptide (TPR) repeat protein
VRLRYRKFDYEYVKLVHKDKEVPKLPIVDICEDRVTLPVESVAEGVPAQTSPIKPAWQRWNDYGIGLLLEGGAGNKKGELLQAEAAFKKLVALEEKAPQYNGHVNLARVYLELGGVQGKWLDEAARELNEARRINPDAWWTLSWLNGEVNLQTATDKDHFDAAIADFERVVNPKEQPRSRDLDFSKDFVVLDRLGLALFKRSQLEADNPAEQERFLLRAVDTFERVLALDSEDLDAHYRLKQCYELLGSQAPEDKASGPPDDADGLLTLAETVAAAKEPPDQLRQAVVNLSEGLAVYSRKPTDPLRPKLPTIRTLIARLRPAFHEAKDPALRGALARLMGQFHGQAHAIFLPDELAPNVKRLYREKHPAANHAAEAIIIYPTNRKGAPGL